MVSKGTPHAMCLTESQQPNVRYHHGTMQVAKLEKALQATKQELGHIKQQFDQRELEYKAEGDEIKEEFAEVNETVASLQQTNATLEEAHAATKAQVPGLVLHWRHKHIHHH